MAYAAFSVVYGEQPSAAKWNILGTNDASFNDGTGIAALAIQNTHLDTDAITLGYGEATANQGTFTAATDLTGVTCTIIVPSGNTRRLLVTLNTNPGSSSAADRIIVYIKKDGSTVQEARITVGATSQENLICLFSEVPAAGTYTFKATMQRAGGTGNITNYASATNPSFLLATLI